MKIFGAAFLFVIVILGAILFLAGASPWSNSRRPRPQSKKGRRWPPPDQAHGQDQCPEGGLMSGPFTSEDAPALTAEQVRPVASGAMALAACERMLVNVRQKAGIDDLGDFGRHALGRIAVAASPEECALLARIITPRQPAGRKAAGGGGLRP
jgi:hypothetical protein